MLDYIIFAVLVFYVLTIVGLFVLRRTHADAPRPYRAVGYPVLPAVYIVMALFIDVEVTPAAANDADVVKKLVEVCPVNIFGQEKDGTLRIVEENLDECTLCDLCVQAAPKGSVRVIKLYES